MEQIIGRRNALRDMGDHFVDDAGSFAFFLDESNEWQGDEKGQTDITEKVLQRFTIPPTFGLRDGDRDAFS
jgi:hypothetical protein